MITSAWTTRSLRIRRPSSLSTFRGIEDLLRISCRKCPPTFSPLSLSVNMYSSRPKGVSLRSGSPPGGSTWITSAPSSASCEEHQWPIIMLVVQSSTRRRESASGLSKLCSWRRLDGRNLHHAQEFQRQIALNVFPKILRARFGTGLSGHRFLQNKCDLGI